MPNRSRTRHRNPDAVRLGRLGGRKGGPARARSLSAEERRQAAARAARARWNRTAAPYRASGQRGGTRGRLLKAAIAEYAAAGPRGARVDRICRRARVNRRMLYHWFGSRDGLLREVQAGALGMMADIDRDAPPDLAAALDYWQRALAGDAVAVRMSLWEALETASGTPLVAEDERRTFWSAAVEQVRAEQAGGRFDPSLDPAQLQLSLIALVFFPFVMPHFTRLITGRSPEDGGFLAERAKFLHQAARLLAGRT
jgi:AcrR family transcriptional regulator